MKKRRFVVGKPHDTVIRNVTDFLLATAQETEKPFSVTVEEIAFTRTGAQNKMYWMWLALLAEEMGMDKNACATMYKSMFAVPLLRANDDEFNLLAESLEALDYDDRQRLWSAVPVTSHKKFSTKLMTSYLEEIDRHAAEMGIILPHPDDLYYKAMDLSR